ncbi:MAG: PHP domain-containing protein, partial [Vicinamibacterales bacterium]
VLSVTDHDTVGSCEAAAAAGREAAIEFVPGIEITSIVDGRDVHVLGYFIDPESDSLARFLRAQRADRVRRVREIGGRLRERGCAIDVEPLIAEAAAQGKSVGRPAIADALVASGHVRDRDDAFARLLGRGQPAFVPRQGVGGAGVIEVIHAAGGIASLAHPGVLDHDDLIPALAEAGLDALEVWHSDHAPEQAAHYSAMAERIGLARSGGSDYHGDGVHRACRIGAVALPAAEFARLEARAGGR